MSENKNTRLVEAILFASPEPLSAAALYERLSEDADIGAALMQLQKEYEARGVNLIEREGLWAFRTAADLAGDLNLEKQVHKKLSRAAMETLAIIAYHQPVTRAEIENIRGVGTHKGTLDALMEMGWIKPGRRRETLGRPLTWVSTTGFLDHFSIESLMDLPGMDEMKASGLLDRRPAIDKVHEQEDLFDGNPSEHGEGGQMDEDDVEEEAEEPYDEFYEEAEEEV